MAKKTNYKIGCPGKRGGVILPNEALALLLYVNFMQYLYLIIKPTIIQLTRTFFLIPLRYVFKFFYIMFFRLFRKIRYYFFRQAFRVLSFWGLSFSDFFDSLFFGSIVLLFFRLFFRYFFSLNPFWYFNLLIYFVSCAFQLKYNLLFYIRKYFLVVLRFTLGKSFWGSTLEIQELIPWNSGFIIDSDPVYYYKVPDISEKSFFNYIFQQIYIFFIFFRLWILKSPLKFIFFNFFVNCFLIFNQLFIFSSFFSLLFLLSRLCFYSSDYSTSDFYNSVNFIERINPRKEYIIPNWENAIVISFLTSRTYNFHIPFEYASGNAIADSKVFFEKLIQIDPSFNSYRLRLDLVAKSVDYSVRKHYDEVFCQTHGREGASYVEIIRKSKKKRYSFQAVLMSGFFGITKETLNTIGGVAKDFVYFRLSGTKEINNIPLQDLPTEFNQLTPKAQYHIQIYLFIKNLNFFCIFNKTTYKNLPKDPVLAPYAEKINGNYTGRSVIRCGSVTKLKNNHITTLLENLNEQKKLQLVKMPADFLLYFKQVDLPFFVRPGSALYALYEHFFILKSFNGLIQTPSAMSMFSFLNPFVTKKVAKDGLKIAHEHYFLLNTFKVPKEQEKYYLHILMLLKMCMKEELPDDFYAKESPSFFEDNHLILSRINLDLAASKDKKPPYNIMIKTLRNIHENGLDIASQHVINCNRLPKDMGGVPDDKFQYKYLEQHGLLPIINPIVPSVLSSQDLLAIQNIKVPANTDIMPPIDCSIYYYKQHQIAANLF